MASRAARLIELLDLLRRQRQALGGPAIAKTLGVSLRTFYRDIDTLRLQGADITGDPDLGYSVGAKVQRGQQGAGAHGSDGVHAPGAIARPLGLTQGAPALDQQVARVG